MSVVYYRLLFSTSHKTTRAKEMIKSIFDFFINYEKAALQIFFYFVRMFFGS